MKLKQFLTLYLFIPGLMILISCAANNEASVPTRTQPNVTQPTPNANLSTPSSTAVDIRLQSTPTPEPTSTLEATSTQKMSISSFPDILLGLDNGSEIGWDFCVPPKASDQIWLASYPYEALLSLPFLVKPKTDYRFPRWSPDGNWISYVETKPSIVRDVDLSSSLVITGTDTVGIMRGDGSEFHFVSDSIPNAMFSHQMGITLGCETYTEITSFPEWSPDGKYIIFVSRGPGDDAKYFDYTYYITEVSSGKTRKLIIQNIRSSIMWNQDNHLIFEGDESVFVNIVIKTIDDIEITTIPFSFPDEDQATNLHKFVSTNQDDTLIAYIFSGDTYVSPKPKQVSLWEFNIVSGEWKKLVDFQKETWTGPQLGTNWATWCDEETKEIIILDQSTWQDVGTVQLPSNMKFQCDLVEYIDENGNDWRIFQGSMGAVENGIWAISLQSGNVEPELLVDLNSITVMAEPEMYLSQFQLRP